MKIHIPLTDVKDQLINFISEGYGILGFAFSNRQDTSGVSSMEQEWSNKVSGYLSSTFPTQKEAGQFLYTPYPGHLFYGGMQAAVKDAVNPHSAVSSREII